MKNSDRNPVETRRKKALYAPPNRMDAIAYGVRARFEESTGFSRIIMNTTINIARTLDVPEKEINRWASNRSSQLASEAKKIKEIKTLLEKYYSSSFGISA